MKELMFLKVKLLFPDGSKSVLSAKFETFWKYHTPVLIVVEIQN
jgi:hypothetical protein